MDIDLQGQGSTPECFDSEEDSIRKRKYEQNTHKFLELVISSHLKHIAPSQFGFIFSIPKTVKISNKNHLTKPTTYTWNPKNNQFKMDGSLVISNQPFYPISKGFFNHPIDNQQPFNWNNNHLFI